MSSRAIFIGHCCKCHVTWPSQLALRLMAWPKNLPRIHKESCRESPSPPLGRETRVRFLKLDANCETIIMNFSRSFYFWGPMDGHVIRPPTPSPAPPIISSSYNFLAPVYNKQKMMSIFLFYWRFFSRMLENFPIGRR